MFFGAYFGAVFAASISQTAVKRLYAVFLLARGGLLPDLALDDRRSSAGGRDQAGALRGRRRPAGRSDGPLTARLVTW